MTAMPNAIRRSPIRCSGCSERVFGYVLPPADKLPPEEKERFSAVYCGLCHTLGKRYGLAGRMLLNYDFTFLAILLSSSESACTQKRCMIHPVKGCRACRSTQALELAADESVILSWWQLQDGIADHGFWKGLKYRAAKLFLGRAYRKARALRPRFDESTQKHLSELAVLEEERSASLDRPADCFARLLSMAAGEVEDRVKARVLEQMLYHLGRWIYLVDAADDLAKDAKSGSYNPVALRYGLENGVWTSESRQMLAATLDASIRVMAASFELYDFGVWSILIQSFVYQGLYAVGNSVLNGTFRKKSHSHPDTKGRNPNE